MHVDRYEMTVTRTVAPQDPPVVLKTVGYSWQPHGATMISCRVIGEETIGLYPTSEDGRYTVPSAWFGEDGDWNPSEYPDSLKAALAKSEAMRA